MKISNNFKTIPHRNPNCLAKLDGSVSKLEIAGGDASEEAAESHPLR